MCRRGEGEEKRRIVTRGGEEKDKGEEQEVVEGKGAEEPLENQVLVLWWLQIRL